MPSYNLFFFLLNDNHQNICALKIYQSDGALCTHAISFYVVLSHDMGGAVCGGNDGGNAVPGREPGIYICVYASVSYIIKFIYTCIRTGRYFVKVVYIDFYCKIPARALCTLCDSTIRILYREYSKF